MSVDNGKIAEDRALKGFVSGGGAVFLALFIGYFLTFFYKLILARSFGPADYGLFEMVITVLGILTVFAGLGLYSGLTRFISLYKAKPELVKGYVSSVTKIQLVSSLLFSIVLFLLAPKITAFFEFEGVFTQILYVVAFILPIKVFTKSFIQVLLAYKKVMISKLGTELVNKGIMLLGILLIIYFNYSILSVALLLLIAYTLTLIYYLYHFQKVKKNFETKEKKYELKRWFSYSYPLLFAGLVGYLLNWTDNLVIGRYLTESDLGIYAVAFSVAYYLFAGSKLFSGVFLPIMTEYYENNMKQFKEIFQTIRTWTVLFSLIVGSVFILYAQQILNLLFGQEYVAGATSLQILAAFFIVANYFYFSSKLLHLEDQTKKILYGDIIALALNLTITIYLVNLLGIAGAAIGSGFSYFLIRYIFHLYSKKYVKFKHDYKHIIKSVIATFSAAIISYYASSLALFYLNVHLIVYAAIAGMLYGLLLLLAIRYLDMVKKEDFIIIDMIEDYTKLNLNIVRKILVR